MDNLAAQGTVTWLHRWDAQDIGGTSMAQLYTIKDVAEVCGLPGPVIMQLVPRTWTDDGWMYTGEQLAAAVTIAANLRRERSSVQPAGVDLRRCARCGASDCRQASTAAGAGACCSERL